MIDPAATSLFEPFRRAYEAPLAAAQAWKAAGGKVVAYFCDNVPDELISAAGFFALRVSGDPDNAGAAVKAYVDPLYTPDVAVRPGFVDAMLDRLLGGVYDLADYLIVPHNRDAIQAVYRAIGDARRFTNLPETFQLYYLDKAWSSSFVSETYNRDEILRLKTQLEAWSAQPITDAALQDAIAEANLNKRLLGQIQALRAQTPPRIAGADALRIIGSSMFMPKATHNRLLEAFLAQSADLPPRPGVRVFVGGSPQDHTRIYEVIEACGATVVAEDHCWGARAFDLPVEGSASAILNLAARFHQKPACSIRFPLQATVQACATRAAAATSEAAIFYDMEEDWVQNWETASEVKALADQGVPSLHLKRQAYGGGDLAVLEANVKAFLAQLGAAR